MTVEKQKDRFDKTESWMRIAKELSLALVIIALIVIVWPVAPKWVKQIRALNIKEAEVLGIKAKSELDQDVSVFAPDNIGNILETSAGQPISMDVVIKGSPEALANARAVLENDPHARFDVLQIRNGSDYVAELLRTYITQLGIKYVVFTRDNAFEGMIDAPVLVAQLGQVTRTYDQLTELAGVTTGSVKMTDSVREALAQMNQSNVPRIAVLDAGVFRTVITREELVSRVMAKALLKSPG